MNVVCGFKNQKDLIFLKESWLSYLTAVSLFVKEKERVRAVSSFFLVLKSLDYRLISFWNLHRINKCPWPPKDWPTSLISAFLLTFDPSIKQPLLSNSILSFSA